MPAISDASEQRASARSPSRRLETRKRRIAVAATGVVLLGALGTVLAFASNPPSPLQGYAVDAGPTGKVTTLTLPQQIGDSGFDFADPKPLWTFFPTLLPTSAPASYRTATGYYDSATGQIISVDALYAAESTDGVHRGVFSITPQALVTLAAQGTLLTDGRSYSPSGTEPANGVAAVECGTYAHDPMCVWADESVLILVHTGKVGTIQSLLSDVLPAITRGISAG